MSIFENFRGTSCIAVIAAVEKRPGIYDRLHPDYKKEEKDRLWIEVCAEIYPNWDSLPDPEKNASVLMIQRKWKNLRDSFRKEYNIRKHRKYPRYPKRKREYMFFKYMKFLEPYMLDSKQEDTEGLTYDSDSNSQDKGKRKLRNTSVTRKKPKNSAETPLVDWENSELGEELNEANNYTFHEDVDEDRYFLLSLLPLVRTFSNQTKLALRVEFLQILQKISFSNNNNDPLSTS